MHNAAARRRAPARVVFVGSVVSHPELLGVCDVADETSGASHDWSDRLVKRIVNALGLRIAARSTFQLKVAELPRNWNVSRYQNPAWTGLR